jgi:hypothetical protein
MTEPQGTYNFEYWESYANQLLHGVLPNSQLKRFTNNSDLLGGYAEATVKTLLKSMLHPFRVSTGSLISPASYGNTQHKLKQLDAIAWDPNPFPPIFEEGDFALVPTKSAVGAVEVKRSVYSRVGEKMRDTLDWAEENIDGASGWRGSGSERTVVVQPGIRTSTLQQARLVPDQHYKALGVVCLREFLKRNGALNRLIEDGRAVLLIEEQKGGQFSVNAAHVAHLVRFLYICRNRFENRRDDDISAQEIGDGLGQKYPGSLVKPNP